MREPAVPESSDSDHPRSVHHSCLCLTGPTAAGKSAAAMAIAAACDRPVEIVTVDSAQVYVGMDIGTAKPSAAERAAVPHHLIDVVEPTEAYSAARFADDAQRLIAAITARGALALLVGGTFLYFKALFEGLDPLPAADPAIRAALQARAVAEGIAALHAELGQVDPPTAARLPPGDTQRILRALEVHTATGVPLSSLHTGRAEPAAWPPVISLEPADRQWLHRRIDTRFAQMLSAGLVDEVRRLRARSDLHADLPSMRCVGYRQTWSALAADDLDGLHERGAAATRQLAKRQLTWLRSLPQRVVVPCDADDVLQRVSGAVTRVLAAPGGSVLRQPPSMRFEQSGVDPSPAGRHCA